MKWRHVLVILLTAALLFVTACSSGGGSAPPASNNNKTGGDQQPSNTPKDSDPEPNNEPDTVTVWTYPVYLTYEEDLPELIKDFNEKYPHIKVEYEMLSWAEGPQKFDVALNSGNPPDLYYQAVSGHFVNTGLAVPLEDFLTPEIKDDFYPGVLELMQIQGVQYGLPLSQSMWTWGGNKRIFEEEGIDWQKIQRDGWTWSEFFEAAKKMTKTLPDGRTQYGLVTDGTTNDFSILLSKNAGLPDVVDENGKFIWNDDRILETLKFVERLRSEGIIPKEVSALAPAQRNQMMYDGEAAIISKGIPYYDTVFTNRNNDIEEGKIEGEKIDFILLPVPHHDDHPPQTTIFGEGYIMFQQKNKKDNEQHLKNVFLVMEALSGAKAGKASNELVIPFPRKSQTEFYEGKSNAIPYNLDTANKMAEYRAPVIENMVDIDVSTKIKQFREQVQRAGFQALFAGESTAEQIAEDFKAKGKQIFGE